MALLGAGLALGAGLLSAHDFWIVPTSFQLGANELLELRGQTSVKFPTSVNAVTPERVASASVISASGDERISDLSISEKSLLLRHRPAGAGQRVVAVALVTRSSRAATEYLKRYIALEGAPDLAERYEREGLFKKSDSVTQLTTKYAKTIVEVGTGGPRAFSRVAGHGLEFVPMTDPTATRAGGELSIRLLFRGRPLAGAHLHAGTAFEGAPADSASAPKDLSLVTDPQGVVRVPLARGGLWNVRTLHAAPAQAAAGQWEVQFATIVFRASGPAVDVHGAAATVRALFAAAERGDMAALDTLYAGDSLTVVEGAGINRGWADYRDHHLGPELKEIKNFKYRPYEIVARSSGDLAWVMFSYGIQGALGTRTLDQVGRGTAILERRGQKWIVRHTQTSSRPRRPTDPPFPS